MIPLIAVGLLALTVGAIHGVLGYFTSYMVGSRWEAAIGARTRRLLWCALGAGVASTVIGWYAVIVTLLLLVTTSVHVGELLIGLIYALILCLPTVALCVLVVGVPQTAVAWTYSLPDLILRFGRLRGVWSFALRGSGMLLLGPGPFACVLGVMTGMRHGAEDRESMRWMQHY